jgi:hypothetical protein
VQRLNNEFCLVQILSGVNGGEATANATTSSTTANPAPASQKNLVEVQVPVSIIKARIKAANASADGKLN